MRIDSTHRPWLFATLAISTVAAAVYLLYPGGTRGPRGGSISGLIFGIAGYSLMIYAALLGLRKKYPVRRLGRASSWMRGHLWLGFLSFPLLLFHAGFAAKGGLTNWLMILLILVTATGLLGALIQHSLPSLMTRLVPLETIYEEIPKIRNQLRTEADELVAPLFGVHARRSNPPRFVWGARPARSHEVTVVEIEREARDFFHEVYRDTIYSFLSDPDGVKNECSNSEQSAALFATLRAHLPDTVHGILADLENICEEERQLKRQKMMYRYLHSWLLLHVPLSLTLIVLGGIHAVVALLY